MIAGLRMDAVPGLKNRIRELREARGWSRQQLADKIGRDRSTVSRLESGDIGIDDEYLQLLSEAFGVHPVEIISDPGDLARSEQERAALDAIRGMDPEAATSWLTTGKLLGRR